MTKPKLIIFASGSKNSGGSGFEKLVEASRVGAQNGGAILRTEIVAVVSDHEHGGVRERADKLNIPFIHFKTCGRPTSISCAQQYRRIVKNAGAEWIALSGWLKFVQGLPKEKTFNIHPALLSQLDGRFGGKGMWGHNVHEAVKKALDAGEITESGLTMHFVTDEYDRGPIFFEHKVPLKKGMTADEIGQKVNKAEHKWQAVITDRIVNQELR